MKENCIQSPLNYIGGKYKLLSQITPLFPKKISTFVDLFCGGCNVAVNVNAEKIICNDLDSNLIGLLKFFSVTDTENLLKQFFAIIQQYDLSDSTTNSYSYYGCDSANGLGSYNREKYLKLRSYFNSLTNNDSQYYSILYVLIVYAFNNQIRFNSKAEFNLPVGKRDFNAKMQEKVKSFSDKLKELNPIFLTKDFRDFDISVLDENSFVYVDPPYLITNATYNEKSGWTNEDEKSLLTFLDLLNEKRIKFALSNVLKSNGKENSILQNWIQKQNYKCYHLDYSYKNSNYHKKNIFEKTDEILITNY